MPITKIKPTNISNTGVYGISTGTDITQNNSIIAAFNAANNALTPTSNTTTNVQFGSIGVGTAASGNDGEIRATNNITAYYSDGRLKTIITTIPNPLDKVNSLSGVVYINNSVAASYGYTDQSEQIGVIAQEVESILPQIVKPAPFDIVKGDDGVEHSKSGQNYKTVQYEKLVPLLIEAIKELTEKVERLEKKQNG
jgi:hypothetical protein